MALHEVPQRTWDAAFKAIKVVEDATIAANMSRATFINDLYAEYLYVLPRVAGDTDTHIVIVFKVDQSGTLYFRLAELIAALVKLSSEGMTESKMKLAYRNWRSTAAHSDVKPKARSLFLNETAAHHFLRYLGQNTVAPTAGLALEDYLVRRALLPSGEPELKPRKEWRVLCYLRDALKKRGLPLSVRKMFHIGKGHRTRRVCDGYCEPLRADFECDEGTHRGGQYGATYAKEREQDLRSVGVEHFVNFDVDDPAFTWSMDYFTSEVDKLIAAAAQPTTSSTKVIKLRTRKV
eukprot:Opistho-1_new@101241